MNAFIAHLLMKAWTAIPPLVLLIHGDNPFGNLAILLLPCRGRTLSPCGEATNRDPHHPAQKTDFPLPDVVLDKAITVFYGCEKMASAFLKLSRS